MAVRPKRRWILFEAVSDRRLTRGEMVHTLNLLASEIGLDDESKPWLVVFESCGENSNSYLGIFKVPYLVKSKITASLEGGRKLNGVQLRSLKSSGSIRKLKRSMAGRMPRA